MVYNVGENYSADSLADPRLRSQGRLISMYEPRTEKRCGHEIEPFLAQELP